MVKGETTRFILFMTKQGLKGRHIDSEAQILIEEPTGHRIAHRITIEDTIVNDRGGRCGDRILCDLRGILSLSIRLDIKILEGVFDVGLIIAIIRTVIERKIVLQRLIEIIGNLVRIEIRQIVDILDRLICIICRNRSGRILGKILSLCVSQVHLASQTTPQRGDQRRESHSTRRDILCLSQSDRINVTIRHVENTGQFIIVNGVHNESPIAHVDRREHEDRLVEEGILTHAFGAERLLRGDNAQDVVTKHILGHQDLDLIVSDSLENRALVLVPLGRDLAQATDAAFFNGGINGERQNDTSPIGECPTLIVTDEIKSRTGLRLIDDERKRVLGLLGLSFLSLFVKSRGNSNLLVDDLGVVLLLTKQHRQILSIDSVVCEPVPASLGMFAGTGKHTVFALVYEGITLCAKCARIRADSI